MGDVFYDFPHHDLFMTLPDEEYMKLKFMADHFNTSMTDVVLVLIRSAKIPEEWINECETHDT